MPALVLRSGRRGPDGDGAGEDELNDGSVEVHHYCFWQIELFQLPQEVHPLLCFFREEADVQVPLEVLGDDGPQEAEGLHSVNWGVTHGDRGGCGWVPPVVHNHLHSLQSVELQVLTAPYRPKVNLPPEAGGHMACLQ